MIHLLRRVHVSRDPDQRNEAQSYCGTYDECSGSGRHGMTGARAEVTCAKCLEAAEWDRLDDVTRREVMRTLEDA